jgi:hypothetical protein
MDTSHQDWREKVIPPAETPTSNLGVELDLDGQRARSSMI